MNREGACYLGIDTSCYTTSIAVVCEGKVVCDKRRMLPVPKGSRGLRQSDAVFHHVRHFRELFSECAPHLGHIAGVGYSAKPCPRDDSYMPVFCVGESFAAACAGIAGVSSYALTHQHGHIYAAFFGNKIFKGTYGVFHVSGGTLDILRAEIDDTVGEIERIGGSLDITCGQLIDRVGVAAGLPFPSGKDIERIYKTGGAKLAVTVTGLSVNLSGAEAQAMRMLAEGTDAAYVCSGVIDCVGKTLCQLIVNAKNETQIKKFIFTGGVICNTIIRENIRQVCDEHDCVCVMAEKPYCGDNACGLALAAQIIDGEGDSD
jgi:N6-L-threonylcarbamoyladenine synthase